MTHLGHWPDVSPAMRRLDSSCMLAPSATRSFRQMGLAQPFRDVIGIGLCGELVQLEPISNGEHRIALQDNCHGFARLLVKAELAGSCGEPNIGWTKIRQASRGGPEIFERLFVSGGLVIGVSQKGLTGGRMEGIKPDDPL